MKNYLSTLKLLATMKYKALLLHLAGLSIFTVSAFYLRGCMAEKNFGGGQGSMILSLFADFFYVLLAFNLVELPMKRSQPVITLKRLKISERQVFYLDILLNSICFAIYMMAEILLIGILAYLFTRQESYSCGPQGILVEFYRNPYLHGLVPLAETGLWIRNLILLLSSAIACSELSVITRHGGNGYLAFVLVLVAVIFILPVEPGASSYFATGLLAIASALAFYKATQTTHDGKDRAEG